MMVSVVDHRSIKKEGKYQISRGKKKKKKKKLMGRFLINVTTCLIENLRTYFGLGPAIDRVDVNLAKLLAQQMIENQKKTQKTTNNELSQTWLVQTLPNG